ncbi:TPA: hypothetical protein N0F65_010982 [Lagenidium giganteum]|uniref:Uncharacterized protein n=1 Tax=Lagenidium giganteum TaxID=4803 RepID=A0AAV2ZD14_9STRA|nr:TPA: hypothetical protein N0F65_010982 [Lagenidium giganteum]
MYRLDHRRSEGTVIADQDVRGVMMLRSRWFDRFLIDFEGALRVVRSQLSPGKYQVLITAPKAQAASTTTTRSSRTALIINREYAVPRIEAELEFDPNRIPPRRQPRTPRPRAKPKAGRATTVRTGSSPFLRLRVFDDEAMAAVVASS